MYVWTSVKVVNIQSSLGKLIYVFLSLCLRLILQIHLTQNVGYRHRAFCVDSCVTWALEQNETIRWQFSSVACYDFVEVKISLWRTLFLVVYRAALRDKVGCAKRSSERAGSGLWVVSWEQVRPLAGNWNFGHIAEFSLCGRGKLYRFNPSDLYNHMSRLYRTTYIH